MPRVVAASGFPEFKRLTDEQGAMGVNMVVFGPPGVGKTTFALTAQGHSETLLFDVDKGRESVLDVDARYESISDWQTLRDRLDTALALKGDSPYKTLVFDSLSSMYHELILSRVAGGQEKQPQLQHYGEAQRILVKFVRDARSLSEFGINTVFTGHVLEERDDDLVNIRLALPEKVRDQVLLTANHVGYLEYQAKTDSRVLHFRPPRRVTGPKFRQTRSGEQMPLQLTNPTMSTIFDHVKKGTG